jgi:hypothetical protein
MSVALRGSSAAAVTAGILLLSRSRRFGQRLSVQVVGDPLDVACVEGPAIVHSPVLAGCGVGRELGHGSLVIVPGPAIAPLATSLEAGGTSGWFLIDRAGGGRHPATQAFVHLCHSTDPSARTLGRLLRGALNALGCTSEPALLDLLFASPVHPLERLSIGLRGGRSMTGRAGAPLTRILGKQSGELPEPLPTSFDLNELNLALEDGRLDTLLDRLSLGVRGGVADWISGIRALDDDAFSPLLCSLVEVGSHLLTLPPSSMLPPLDAATDAVAVGLGAGLGATRGEPNANRSLVDMFEFLGGRFVPEAKYAIEVSSSAPPEGRLPRWAWLCREVQEAERTADTLWRQVVDPPQ